MPPRFLMRPVNKRAVSEVVLLQGIRRQRKNNSHINSKSTEVGTESQDKERAGSTRPALWSSLSRPHFSPATH